jgi:hypothetical protein
MELEICSGKVLRPCDPLEKRYSRILKCVWFQGGDQQNSHIQKDPYGAFEN